MSDCGCDAPKYSAGFCYGMWSGRGCLNRGRLWDVTKCGNIIIRYPDKTDFITLEVITPKGTEYYKVEPKIPLDELKQKFKEYRDMVYVDDRKLIIRIHVDEVVAELLPL